MTGNTKKKISTSGIITLTFLLSLIVINVIWLIIRVHGGVLMAIVFYAVVFFLCFRSRHFGAGVIAGIFGFGIHIYELLVKGTTELTGIEQVFFYANLIFPIPITLTSYLSSRKELPEHED